MRIVKELFRLAATVWLILLMAVIVDMMTETADACGSPDCVPTNTPYPTGTLVPTDLVPTEVPPTDTPYPTKTEESDDDDDPTRTPKPTRTPESSDTPKPTKTEAPELTSTPDPTPDPSPEPSFTPDPTDTPEPTVTKRSYDCHKDGDKICEGDLTPVPLIVVFTNTPIPPTPTPTLAPTETSMVQAATAVACPNTCCCLAQAGVGSEAIDYSEVILEFKPIAYILIGIFGVNTLLKTYGTFRKD